MQSHDFFFFLFYLFYLMHCSGVIGRELAEQTAHTHTAYFVPILYCSDTHIGSRLGLVVNWETADGNLGPLAKRGGGRLLTFGI